ncbi:cbb3-type cytochrome c oxidase subunit II [Puniceicoccaceae bacterium K14]|nr:cbb3-type cytochrome c oxidase subunit II [Puniceicoccaceae bacterium K14]
MNRGPFIFIGLFIILALSWAYTLDRPQAESGKLSPIGSSSERMPRETVGLAAKGKEVYQEMGCIACHTQQVRFESGSDIARGWGERQSVARDYIDQNPVLLGHNRIGSDLTNVGLRYEEADVLHQLFYNPRISSSKSNMPSYSFLYEERKIIGQASDNALVLPDEYAPEEGMEIVPTSKANALVAYMLSLKADYDLVEAPSLKKVDLK